MIKFKNDVQGALPYNRNIYASFLKGNSDVQVQWYGVSFQLPGGYEGREIDLQEYFEAYENWFKKLILQFDNVPYWVVNHDIDDYWFPNEEDTLGPLRTIFAENNIPNEFSGALILTTTELLTLSNCLISYPFSVFSDNTLYDDLDISHSMLPLIIKVSAHMNIDILSTDKELLKNIVSKNNNNRFIKREYRGTSL